LVWGVGGFAVGVLFRHLTEESGLVTYLGLGSLTIGIAFYVAPQRVLVEDVDVVSLSG